MHAAIRRLAPLVLVAALAVPATASAQGPTPTLELKVENVGAGKVSLAGKRFRVRGIMRPFVANQAVTVTFSRGSKDLRSEKLTLYKSKDGTFGTFLIGLAPRSSGTVTVHASHEASPEVARLVADPVNVRIIPRRAVPGQRGPAVRELQRQLKSLGYVVGQRGLYDQRTARAVQAFRKMVGLPRTFIADSRVFSKLAAGKGRFKVRYPSHGRHIEGDLSHQVLALIGPKGRVERLYTMSSGKPSTPTILGHFRVYSKTPGTNAKGMVDSSYFIRGYAVHGYYDVPPYPASHGCLRVPVPDARSIFNWIRYGTPVDVYYR